MGQLILCTQNQSAVPNILMQRKYFDKNYLAQGSMSKKYWIGLTQKF